MKSSLLLASLAAGLRMAWAAGGPPAVPEAVKARSNQVWDSAAAQGSVVQAGAAARNISQSPDGKPWGEPFTPKHSKKGHYVVGDPCEDLNHNGKCDQNFFAGYQKFENPKRNWWRWLFRGVHRDPDIYNTPDGVLDDLYTRAAVLKVRGKTLAMVEVDAVCLEYTDTQKIRERVKDLGFDNVIVAVTHNHEGPDTCGIWGPVTTPPLLNPVAWLRFLVGRGNNNLNLIDGKNPKYMENLYEQSAAALREAYQSARPADLYFAEQRLSQVEGQEILNKHRTPDVADLFAHIFQAKDKATHVPILTMAEVAVHPELLGDNITQISADIAGEIARRLEALFGGIGIAITNGAIASVGPAHLDGGDPDPAKDLALRIKAKGKFGDAVGKTTLEALSKSLPAPIADVDVSSRAVFIPMDNALFRLAYRKKVLDLPLFTAGAETRDGQDLMTEMDIWFFKGPKGEPLAELFSIPGELAPEIYLGGFLPKDQQPNPQAPDTPVLKDYLRAPHQFLIGLGNSELGYIIPMNDFRFPRLLMSLLAQKDRFGRRHYEETVSAGSQMSQIVTLNLIGMLQEHYDGSTQWSPEAVALKARRDALEAYAGQKEAIPALAMLYAHEPDDEATARAREVLLDMARNPARSALIADALHQAKAGVNGDQKKKDISNLIWELREMEERRERAFDRR